MKKESMNNIKESINSLKKETDKIEKYIKDFEEKEEENNLNKLSQNTQQDLLTVTEKFEGFRMFPYKCSEGYTTIGYGYNLDANGISKKIAEELYEEAMASTLNNLEDIFPGFYEFGRARKIALLTMHYNLGNNSFREFKSMIGEIKNRNWRDAAHAAMNSLWATQVKERAHHTKYMLLYNKYPEDF